MRNIARIFILLLISSLFACSNGNGFKLRTSDSLPEQYRLIQLSGVNVESVFGDSLRFAIESAKGRLSNAANASKSKKTTSVEITPIQLKINSHNFVRRIAAYSSTANTRTAREYLLTLTVNYQINRKNKLLAEDKIVLDGSYLYDAQLVLDREDRDSKLREKLYNDATRLILLKMRALK